MASAERRIARPRSSQCFVDEYHRLLNVWAQGREGEQVQQVQQALFTAGFRFYFKKQMVRWKFLLHLCRILLLSLSFLAVRISLIFLLRNIFKNNKADEFESESFWNSEMTYWGLAKCELADKFWVKVASKLWYNIYPHTWEPFL